MGKTGRGKKLGQRKFSREGSVNCKESQGDRASDVSTIGVYFSVVFLQWTGTIRRTELQHIIHSVGDLMKYEDDLGVYQSQAFEGAFDSWLITAEGEESLRST